MAINILLLEDESIVRKDIERSLTKLGYNVVAQADNGDKALELAREAKPDLALMDIQIKGDKTGIETAELLKQEMDIPVIFLTAFADESTLTNAKEVEPHGYVLKPFKEIDLKTTIELAVHKHQKEKELKVEYDLLKRLSDYKATAEFLFVRKNQKLVKINHSDICFIEALKDYMQLVLHRDGKEWEKITIHATMKDVERKLPKKTFQRVHRSFIVNMDKVIGITGGDVIIQVSDGPKVIPVGGNYRDDFGERINVL
jgi:DNA-binding LytR/AlgR family response regulator